MLSRMIITRKEWTCLLILLWSSTILETLAKIFISSARQIQFLQENIFNKAPVRRIAIAMNTNSTFTGSSTENPFWYQQFDLRHIRILRGDQPIVACDAVDNCCNDECIELSRWYPLSYSWQFKDHYVLVFDMTSMQDATEIFHSPELVGEPPRLELNFTFPLEHVTELIVLGERMSSVIVDKFGFVGKKTSKWIMFLSSN